MLIYSSDLRKKVEFSPEFDEVRIYVCGPTVYDDAHLGHAKSAVSFDLLRRVLILLGYKVKFIKNFTDIDDKILKKMQTSGKNLKEITEFYIKRYLQDMDGLNVLRADIEPKATQTLKEILEYIKILMDKNIAYRLDDGIYFDTSKDEKYLNLSKQNSQDVAHRVKNNESKKNERDFVLWKFDENWYESDFGKGRPGWHTECVAMIKKYFKSGKFNLDIHAGGADLLFPHHENEASQCRCAMNNELSKYWMHNGFVQVNNEKMSKSLGNSFFIKDALNLVCGEVLRFYLLSSHYRANFNYSLQDLFSSKKRLDKIYRLKIRVLNLGEISAEILEENLDKNFKDEILKFLSDDLNISPALAILDEFVNLSNENLDKNPKDKNLKIKILANLNFASKIFGILQNDVFEYFQFGVDENEKSEILKLIENRNLAKQEKDFKKADEIRDILKSKNILLLDTPQGTKWEKICEI